MNEKMTLETAQAELTKWLDYKRISSSKRELLKEAFDELVEAMVEGLLVLDEGTHELTYTLKFQPENSELKELIFKPRVASGTLDAKLKNVGTEVNARVRAYACVITGNTPNDFRVLDTSDMAIVQNIVAYFF